MPVRTRGHARAGKSSLMSVVGGFRKATSGAVVVGGEPVFENPSATRRVCLIRERGDTVDGDWPETRVRNALAFAALMRPCWDAAYAAELVERFGLRVESRIGALSRGERAALASVLGLASRAPVTVFDEPHLGMDAPMRQAFYDEVLTDFMKHPRTVLLSTHLIEEVGPLLEEVVTMDGGRLVLHEAADELRARGTSVIGPADVVDRVTEGLRVFGERTLGPTKSVMVYGGFDAARRAAASAAGLELGRVPLQDVFIHLTGTPEESG